MKKRITLVVFDEIKILHVSNESLPIKPQNAQLVQEFDVDKVLINI